MIKLEIELDTKLLEAEDYDVEKVIKVISDAIRQSDYAIEEKNENGYFLYRGKGLNTDLAHIAMIVDALADRDWFKLSCKKLNLLSDTFSDDGSFIVEGDWIRTFKKYGKW